MLVINGNNNIKWYLDGKCHRLYYGNNEKHYRNHISKKHYKGKVYCITTKKNHSVFAGRNGTFIPVGQSTFGVMGNQHFRLYDVRIASSITYLVRDLIHYTKKRLKKEEIDVIYYDTDSVFTTTKEDISDKLNQYIQEWGKLYGKDKLNLRYDYEGYFDSLFLLAKCHYYGNVHGKDKPEIKGVEITRSSSSKYEAYFQETLLKQVLSKKTQEEILNWIYTEKKRIRTLPIEEIGFPAKFQSKTYKNYPIFIRAYELTKNIKPSFEINSGELFYYVYVKPIVRNDNVLAFKQDDKDFLDWDIHLDWNIMIDRNIINKAKTIFEAQKWDTSKLISPDQIGLF
jgi:DNA polymerase elongation subunit (family B)